MTAPFINKYDRDGEPMGGSHVVSNPGQSAALFVSEMTRKPLVSLLQTRPLLSVIRNTFESPPIAPDPGLFMLCTVPL